MTIRATRIQTRTQAGLDRVRVQGLRLDDATVLPRLRASIKIGAAVEHLPAAIAPGAEARIAIGVQGGLLLDLGREHLQLRSAEEVVGTIPLPPRISGTDVTRALHLGGGRLHLHEIVIVIATLVDGFETRIG